MLLQVIKQISPVGGQSILDMLASGEVTSVMAVVIFTLAIAYWRKSKRVEDLHEKRLTDRDKIHQLAMETNKTINVLTEALRARGGS